MWMMLSIGVVSISKTQVSKRKNKQNRIWLRQILFFVIASLRSNPVTFVIASRNDEAIQQPAQSKNTGYPSLRGGTTKQSSNFRHCGYKLF